MNKKIHDILNTGGNINTEKLMSYLADEHLSESERHEIEKLMLEDPFVADAAEGLESISSTDSINAYVQELNMNLRKQVAAKKKRRDKLKLPGQQFTIIAIIMILILLIVSYLIIHKLI